MPAALWLIQSSNRERMRSTGPRLLAGRHQRRRDHQHSISRSGNRTTRQNVSRYGTVLQRHSRWADRPRQNLLFRSLAEQRQQSTSQVNLTTLSPAGKAKLRRYFPPGKGANADLYLNVTSGINATGQFSNIDLGADPVTGAPRGSVEAGVGLFAFPQKLDDRQTVWKIDHHFRDRDIL